jgi:Ca2+-binding RTX toxin-like protein
MQGGDGDDTYRVDNAADIVSETSSARGPGFTDTVVSTINLDLSDPTRPELGNIENLSLIGGTDATGNNADNVITGNAADNFLNGLSGNDTIKGAEGNDRLYGESGNDTLDGGAGSDTMVGGLGDDTYWIDHPGDVVRENPGEGRDLIKTLVGGLDLSKPELAAIEDLELLSVQTASGYTYAPTASGNDLANVMTGNQWINTLKGAGGSDTLLGLEGADTLDGGSGNDRLDGGAGNDVMTGGAGNDTYVVSSTADVVNETETGHLSGQIDTVESSVDFSLNDPQKPQRH